MSRITKFFEPLHAGLSRYMARAGLLSPMASLTAADFAAARVTNPAQSEIVRNTLYDSLLYPAAGTTQLTFFSLPIGQGITTAQGGTVGSSKTYADTNMELGGQLPSGKSFLVESIEVLFLPGSVSTANTYTPATIVSFAAVAAATIGNALNDINLIYQSGWLELNILSKNYLREAPLLKFPPKAQIEIDAAFASNSATTSEVIAALGKDTGRPYYVEPKILLQPAVNFEVKLQWPGAVAPNSGFNGRVMVSLDGGFMRASQ